MQRNIISTTRAATLLGVGPTTIKRWADDGTLPSLRTAGGHRRFRRSEVERLLQQRAVNHGAATGSAERWVQLLSNEQNPHAIQAALLDERAQLESWARVADNLGAVLERIGEQWERGELSVVQEHLVSERLARAIAACSAQIPVRNQAPRCLLATPPDELHTLGLSLAELCARETGWSCQWVGARTPTKDLIAWMDQHPVNALVLSASRWSQNAAALRKQHSQLAQACQHQSVPLVLGGEGAWPEPIGFGHRVHLYWEFAKLLRQLDSGEVHHVAS